MKYAQNSPKSSKFHSKNVFLFLVALGWNSNSISTLLKACFLLNFKGVAQKIKIYVFYEDLIDDLNLTKFFQKVKHHKP